jgi:TP901 family phage tail tape measure protein
MADDIRSDIIINVDTSVGIAEIKNLQRQISQLNAQLLKSGAQQAASAQNIQRNLINNINATGQFAASVKNISTTAESFTTALERNKLGMGEYFRYAGASTKTFGRLFRSEFDTIEKVARERVKTLQTQYVKLGRDGSGAMKAIAVRPLALDMENLATKTAVAAQKQQLFNQLIKQGSTNLLNFGKNTQWAGRQLMVGFTIPLAIFGSMAVKEFEKIEKQAIRFKRVYGDAFDSEGATDKALEEMKRLADGFTKYGVEVNKTLELAADAAQMGLTGANLRAQVTEATRLAVLGEVDQQEALRATIAVTDAFGVAAEDLAGKIDFLNSVENETVTAINDLTIAIPKAGPVVKQLGGSVEDLAFFLTAMKEGGINASEGANALKSGLAALINPTGKAAEMLNGLGVNVQGIVEANKGDVKGIVIGFAQALDTLDPLNRARAIEQLFGKFQFSRLSTLFQNVIKEGSQAERVLKLTAASTEELAIVSERELKRVESSPLFKFQSQLEKFQAALAPIGEEFLKAITPVLKFASEVLKNFNNLSDGAKQFAVVATTLVAGIGPVFLMMFGLIANGAANIIKLFANLMSMFSRTGASSRDLGISTDYMTQQQLEATAVASSLNQSHSKLIQTFAVEAGAVDKLAASYGKAIVQQSRFLGRNPRTGGPAPKGYARGVLSVPGPKGAGDVVPAMLSPGEAVIPAKQASKYRGLVSSMISDDIPGYRFGLNPFASMLGRSKVATRMDSGNFINALRASGKDGRYQSAFTTGTGADYITKHGLPNEPQKKLRSAMERDVFGLDPKTTPISARPTYGYAKTSVLQSLVNRIFGLKGKNFNAATLSSNDALDKYGNIDLVTKGSVAKRSSAYPGDSLLHYNWAVQSWSGRRSPDLDRIIANSGINPAQMRGASPEQLRNFERLGKPYGSNRVPGTTSEYTTNPKPSYIETYTPGGFSFKEIDKIIARDPAIAKQLRQELKAAGLGGVRVAGPGFVSRLFKGIGVPGYRRGTESVPSARDEFNVFLTERLRALRIKTRGSTPDIKNAFKDVKKYSSWDKEFNAFEKAFRSEAKRTGMKPAEIDKRIADYKKDGGYEVSHVKKDANTNTGVVDKNGVPVEIKNWRAENVIKEQKAVNQILSNIHLKGAVDSAGKNLGTGSFIPSLDAKEIAKMARLPLKVTQRELAALADGEHPITKNATKTLIAVAEKYRTFPDHESKSVGARVRGLQAILRRRLRDNSFFEAARLGQLTVPISQRAAIDAKAASEQEKNVNAFKKRLADERERLGLPLEDDTPAPAKTSKSASTKERPAVKNQKTPRRPAETYKTSELLGAKDMDSPNQKPKLTPTQSFVQKMLGMVGRRPFLRRKNNFDPRLFLSNGIVSVPGPKGKGDVVPAMLSPGEAVIPAKESQKYAGLIQQMVHGTIPGYEKSNVPKPSGLNPPPAPDVFGGYGGSYDYSESEEEKKAKKRGGLFGKAAFAKDVVVKAGKQVGTAVASGIGTGAKAVGNAALRPIAGFLGTVAGNQVVDDKGRVINQEALDRKEAMKNVGLTQGPRGGYKDAAGNRVDRAVAEGRIAKVMPAGPGPGMTPKQQFAQGAQRIGMAGMGVSMAASAATMIPGEAGKVAGEIAPLAIGLSTLAMFIQGPMSAAFVAIVAVAGMVAFSIMKANEAYKQSAEEVIKLRNALGGGTEAIRSLSVFAGKVTAGEIADRRRQNKFGLINVASGKSTFGENFVQSETGTALLESIKKQVATDKGDTATATGLISDQLKMGVVSGAVSIDQASSIAAQLGAELGDASIGIKIRAEIQELVGPNGEDLEKDPLLIATRLADTSVENLNRTSLATQEGLSSLNYGALGKGSLETQGSRNLAAGGGIAASAAAGAGIGAGIGAIFAAPTAGLSIGVGAVIGTIAGAVTGFMTIGTEMEKLSKQAGAMSGAYIADSTIALQQQNEIMDVLDNQYEKKLQEAAAEGDITKYKKLQIEYDEKKNALALQSQKVSQAVLSNYEKADAGTQEAMMAGVKAAADVMYKDDPNYALYKPVIDSQIATSGISGSQEILLRQQMLTGDLDPAALSQLLTAATGTGKMDAVMNIVTKFGGDTASEMNSVLNMIKGEDAEANTARVNLITSVENATDDAEAQKLIDFAFGIQALGGVMENSVNTFLNYYEKDSDAKEALKGITDSLDAQEVTTVDLAYEVNPVLKETGLDGDAFNEEYFNKLKSEEEKETYIQTISTILNVPAPQVVASEDFKKWLADEGAVHGPYPGGHSESWWARTYAESMGQKVTNTGIVLGNQGAVTPPKPPSGGGAKEDPLEEHLKRLKEVRAAAVDATGGVTELAKWLGGNKNMKQFQGLEQRLMGRGANRTFIDYILGLDKDVQQRFVTFKDGILKIKAAGKNLAKMFNEIALGEYQISLKEASREAENQSKAFNKLVGAGMSVSEALAAIEDPATAAAIASKSISSEELKKLGKDANDAAAKVGLVAAKLQLAADIQKAAGEMSMRSAFDTNNTKFTELQQAAIEFDSTLSDTYQKFLTGMIKELPPQFAARMQQVIDDIEFKQSVFDDGFGKAMEAFSAQEEKLQIDMEINLKNFSLAGVTQKGAREIMTEAQNEIAALQFKMDDLNAGIQEIEWQEDEVNKKYDKRLEALDKIEKANEAISAQQKTQISLADALTQGDIAAAARAAQEMRSQSAQGAIGNQRDVLEAARQGALENLRSSGGKTRGQLESDILNIQKQIFRIEEQRLEPATEAVRLAEAKLAKDTASLTVLGKTSFEWTQVKNGIDLATTSSKPFIDAMQAALDIVKSIVGYWNTLGTKKLAVTNPLDPYGILEKSGTASTHREYFENTVLPAIASGTASGSQTIDYANAVNQALGRPMGTPVAMAKGGEVKYMPMGGLVPYMNMGGSVRMPKREPAPAQRMSNGGIFQPKGTDTVPAMLTPGEFVIRKYAVQKYGVDKMKAINSGTHSSDSVYNYEVNVNVKTDANADQIARSVIGQIKQIDSQRIRGNKF